MNPRILILLALVLLASSVFATQLSGNFYAEDCQCTPIQRTLTLTNDSSSVKTYNMSVQGTVSNWFTIAPKALTLQPGQSTPIYLYAMANCYAEGKSYFVNIIANDGTEQLSKPFEIKVLQCHVLDVDITPSSATVGQCEGTNYNVRVTNSGEFDEEVSLGVSGVEGKWLTIGDTFFNLNIGQSVNVPLSIDAPCRAEARDYPFEAIGYINRANVSYADSALFRVLNLQNVDVTISSTNISYCMEEGYEQTLTIRNNGNRADTYTLLLNAPEFVSISEDSVSLGVGESESVRIVYANTTVTPDTYDVEVTVRSNTFGNEYPVSVSAQANKCYGFGLEALGAISDGSATQCIEELTLYEYGLTNTGTREVAVALSLKGLEGELSSEELVIGAGETETVRVTIDARDGEEGTETLTLNVRSAYFSVSADTEITLQECYGHGVAGEDQVLCRSIETVLPMNISNTGIKDVDLGLELEGPEWLSLEQDSVTVPAGQTASFNVIARPNSTADPAQYTVTASNAYMSVSTTHTIDFKSINECFGIGIEVDVNTDDGVLVCSVEQTEVFVRNLVNIPQNVTLEADIKWAHIVPESVSVEGNGAGVFYLNFSPTLDIEPGDYELTLTAESNYGATDTAVIPIRVLPLEEPDTGFTDLNILGADSELKQRIERYVESTVQLQNTGTNPINIIGVQSLNWRGVTFVIGNTNLAPGETTLLQVNVPIPEEYDSDIIDLRLRILTPGKEIYRAVSFDMNGSTVFNQPIEEDTNADVGGDENQLTVGEVEEPGEGELETVPLVTAGFAKNLALALLLLLLAGLVLAYIKYSKEAKAAEGKKKNNNKKK